MKTTAIVFLTMFQHVASETSNLGAEFNEIFDSVIEICESLTVDIDKY